MSSHALCCPWTLGQNRVSFSKQDIQTCALPKAFFFFFYLRIYLYEKSYQGINILGLCACWGLNWNVPTSPLPVCLPGEFQLSMRTLLQGAFSDPCPPNPGAATPCLDLAVPPVLLTSWDNHPHFSFHASLPPQLLCLVLGCQVPCVQWGSAGDRWTDLQSQVVLVSG